MARELRRMGVRLTAEGVNQYKEDLRSAGREARLMSQETRLAMAELGTGASSTERLTTRLKGLGREYNVQEQRVKTLTNSQKEFQTSLNLVGREIKTTSSQLKDSQRETNRLENNYRKMGEALGWNAEETKKAKAEWEASKNETKQLANSLSDLEREQSQYTKELNKMPGQINSAKIAMQEKANEMARLREEYIKNGGALGDYADKVQETSQKVRTFSEGVASVGDRLTTGVTLPIVAGVTSVVKAASDWESAFAGTRKTVDEVVDANGDVIYSYERLEDELRGLAKQLPATHDEIAEVAEAAGQLGIETENVISFTRTMIDMGESTNLSAEQAASSLARLANITGMSQEDFDRLGSSVVGLGNNFATTEAEIVQMGLRLAGTGNQIGMTEADIMGLAAAMSSVGIQAEAGGTAMSTVLKRMQNAVADGSEELSGFAKVARMSASEFADAFREDPARALQAFVEGLELSSEEGENLNAILGDLGITGIREADTLLRLAGNSELLGDALDISATSWEENSALAEEAGVRYETLESQLGMLRNEVYDIAIEFGGPFVKALRDAMQAARPMLENVSDLAQAFSDLDEEQQETILKFIGITAAAGPALSIIGRVGQGAANAGDGFAWLIRKVGGLQAAAQTADPIIRNTGSTIADLGPIATTAAGSKGVGGLVTAVGTSLPWALGLAGVAFAGFAGWKKWGEDAYESRKRTERWGASVSEETDKVLTEFQELADGVGEATDSMSEDAEAGGQKAMQGYSKMVEGIKGTIDENIQEIEGFYSGLDTTTKGILEESTTEQIKGLQKIKEEAETYHQAINRAYAKAIEENRELTDVEMNRIERYQRKLAELQAEALGGTEEQIRQTQAVLLDQLKGMTAQQLQTRRDAIREDAKLTSEHHAEQLAQLEEQYALGRIEEEEYNAAVVSMRSAQQREMNKIMDEHIKTAIAQGQEEHLMVDTLTMVYEEYGYTREEIEARIQEMLKSTQDEAYALDQMWRDLLIDPVTGEVVTNLPEVLADMLATDEGWDNLHFMIKEANLTTNALATLEQALMASGEWDKLDPEVQELLADAAGFMREISKSEEELNRWNALPEEDKLILGNNLNLAMEILESEEMYNNWLNLPEKDKHLLGNNEDLLRKILSSEKEYNRWLNLPEKEKRLLANNSQVYTAVDNAQRKLNSLRDRSVTLTVRNQTIYESIYRTRGNPTSANFVQSGGRILHNATGTNYFEGGLTWLGDGGKREPYLTPDGEFGVSGSSNEIYDLPRGTRIWPTRQAFKTSARSNPEYRKFIDYLPKFAKGGTIRNPYEGYTALVGEAGPEIFQIAQGNVSITPISQGQRTKVLEQQTGGTSVDMSETNQLLQTLIQLVAQGQTIQMDKVEVGRSIYDEVDSIMSNNFQRRTVMNMGGGRQ